MKMNKPLKVETPWDVAAAVMFMLLAGNFIVFVVLCLTAIGLVFLEPAAAVITALILLLGIACHFVTRHRTTNRWRRLLLGGIAANFFIVGFFVLVVVVMLMAWTNIADVA